MKYALCYHLACFSLDTVHAVSIRFDFPGLDCTAAESIRFKLVCVNGVLYLCVHAWFFCGHCWLALLAKISRYTVPTWPHLLIIMLCDRSFMYNYRSSLLSSASCVMHKRVIINLQLYYYHCAGSPSASWPKFGKGMTWEKIAVSAW